MGVAGRGVGAGGVPGGGVSREVWEETGIHVEVDQLTGVCKNTSRSIVALVFRCKPSGAHIRRIDRSRMAHPATDHRAHVRGLRDPPAGRPRRGRPPRPEPRRQAPAPSALELSLLHQGGSLRSPRTPRLRRSRGWSEHRGGEKPAVAGAVGSTALATSPVRVPCRARPGGHSFNSGKDHSLPELPASVRPPDHARPQTGRDTGQTRSADLCASALTLPLHLFPTANGDYSAAASRILSAISTRDPSPGTNQRRVP